MISFVNYFLPMDRYGRQKLRLVGLTVLALSLCYLRDFHASTLTVYVDTTRKFEGDDYQILSDTKIKFTTAPTMDKKSAVNMYQ